MFLILISFSFLLTFLLCFNLNSNKNILEWRQEYSFTSSLITKFTLNKRGNTYLIGSKITTEEVLIYYQNEINSISKINLKQTLKTPSQSLYDNYGYDIELEGDFITGNILIISSNGLLAKKKYNGGVFYYNGENTRWSLQQSIFTKEMMNEPWTFYGTTIDIDSVSKRVLIVGCSNCTTSSKYINDGIIYVFTPISFPEVRAWTEQQKLTSNNLYSIGTIDVEIYDNTLVGIGYTTPPKNSWTKHNGIIYQKDKITGIWSETQTLTPKTNKITDLDIFEDTIVMSSNDYRYKNTNNAGVVLVFYPNTIPFNNQEFNNNNHNNNNHNNNNINNLNIFDKIETIQWSQQQSLYTGNTLSANLYYGSTVKIWGNTMAITELGSGYVYVLEREYRSGMWSQQMVIQVASASSLLNVALRGSDIVVSDGTNVYGYTNNLLYNCLRISLEDHFGDGWDIARLIVESSYHGFETFSPECDTENPLQIRYCPTDLNENGHYKFKIINSEKAAFRWEIIWRIYEERSGLWFFGNWETIMEFDWARHENGFHNRNIIKPLPNNITCIKCLNETKIIIGEPKIVPNSQRQLDPIIKPKTSSPTISPAPTIYQAADVNWRYFRLHDTSNLAWFNSIHRGTSYYISDIHGLHLLTVGTLCFNMPGLCYINLPNGHYTLRIGGALDVHKATHQWRFCKIQDYLNTQSHLEFIIEDEKCLITSYYTRDNYCKHVKDYSIVLKIQFNFILSYDNTNRKLINNNNNNNYHTHNFKPISYTLTQEDIQTLQGILASILSQYQIHGIKIIHLYYTTLEIQLLIHPDNDIFETQDTFHSAIETLSNSVYYQLDESISTMLLKLSISSSPSSYFHHVTSISILSVIYDGISSESSFQLESDESFLNEYNDNDNIDNNMNENLLKQQYLYELFQIFSLIGWSIWLIIFIGVFLIITISVYRYKKLKDKNLNHINNNNTINNMNNTNNNNNNNNEIKSNEELEYTQLDTSNSDEIDLEINNKNSYKKKYKKEKRKEKRERKERKHKRKEKRENYERNNNLNQEIESDNESIISGIETETETESESEIILINDSHNNQNHKKSKKVKY